MRTSRRGWSSPRTEQSLLGGCRACAQQEKQNSSLGHLPAGSLCLPCPGIFGLLPTVHFLPDTRLGAQSESVGR